MKLKGIVNPKSKNPKTQKIKQNKTKKNSINQQFFIAVQREILIILMVFFCLFQNEMNE